MRPSKKWFASGNASPLIGGGTTKVGAPSSLLTNFTAVENVNGVEFWHF
jgi:hypothetical protein